MKKEKMTDYERDIYRSTCNNFDLAVAILESDLGIIVTKNMAEHMLKEYVTSKAHMYYWATLYNIPWMLLYFSTPRPCYGLIVKKESSLYQYLIKRKDVRFTPYFFRKGYVRVENNGYLLNRNIIGFSSPSPFLRNFWRGGNKRYKRIEFQKGLIPPGMGLFYQKSEPNIIFL